jgi:TolB-like protein/Tfp pilus assembly protein PilF
MAALDRVRSSAGFRASSRRRALLGYIVEQGLSGREDQLRAHEIAVAVLGRDESFDPQTDPIVRMEVGRLRRDLEHYDLTAGRDDPLRIAIPKGSYVPVFQPGALAPEARPPPGTSPAPAVPAEEALSTVRASGPAPGRRRLAIAAGVLALGLVALVSLLLALRGGGHAGRIAQAAGPAVIVQPFRSLSPGEDGRLLASGITGELIADLMRFDNLEVYAGAPPEPGEADMPPAAAERVAFVVTGGVQEEDPRFRVTVRLTDRATGQVLWSQRFDRDTKPADILDVQAEIAAGVASHLAQPYGIVTSAAAQRLGQAEPATMFAYNCVQRAFAFRVAFSRELYPPVRACLEESVRRDPGYADAWAMLAFAHLDAARFGLAPPAAKAGEMAAGLEAARHAVALAPKRARSQQALAALLFMSGDHEAAERVQRAAIALNPNDPESLAQLGWRLMVRGRGHEGRTYLQAAIDRSIRAPSWYHSTLALALYLDGAVSKARDAAELGSADCCAVGQAALAIAEAAVGDTPAAHAALGEAVRQAPILARDPRAFWSRFQMSGDVADRLVAGLRKAGLVVAARADTPSPPPTGSP